MILIKPTLKIKKQRESYFSLSGIVLFLMLVLFPFFSIQRLSAQSSTDFLTNVGIEFSKNLSRFWEFSFSEEIRLNNFSSHYARSETALGIDYKTLNKKTKWGLSYSLLNKENNDFYYENQHRLTAQFYYKERLSRNVKLNWRTKLQSTYRNENIADYKVNPKFYLRNKIQLNYVIPFSRMEPTASCEVYYSLNDLEQNRIDKIRTSLGLDYLISPKSSLEFYLRYDADIQVKEPENNFNVGAFYKYSF